MSDSESILLERFARTGDPEAFSELVQRHAGLVYGASWRILADRDKAADAAQDTFFQLLRNARGITGSLPNWLHSVVTHKAIDVLRRDSSRRQREAAYAVNKPRQVTKWQELSPYIDEALEELDDDTRQVLMQHFFEGQTAAEIAGKQGLSQPTVSRRIESGVMKLRDKLHRRGIVIAAAELAVLLGGNAVQAAPAIVLKELGKMALLGGHAAIASGAGTSGAGAKAVAGGVLAGAKAKIIAAAAVTALGIGSVVTYQQVTGPSKQSDESVAEEVTSSYPRSPSDRRAERSTSNRRPIVNQSQQEWTLITSEPANYKAGANSVVGKPVAGGDIVPQKPAGDKPAGGDAVGYGGDAMGGGAGPAPAGDSGDSPQANEEPPMPAGDGGYGGGFFAAGVAGPNEPNIPDEYSPSDEP
jgi:RNA polymerase sigma factor (sigma-70 family)